MTFNIDYVNTPMGMIHALQLVGGVPAVVLLLSAHDLSSIVGRSDVLLMVIVAGICLVTSVAAMAACLVGSPDLPYSCLMKLHSSIAMAAYVPSSANYVCTESKEELYSLRAFAGVFCVLTGLMFLAHAIVAHQPISGNV
ncbi:hypothetical protein HPB48_008172 [Haemaphysalis longicornis]|uniref:Uncharacterized protein n=1 Tax=Haemaphysalis longicornis TaxID=44386 RepID=A0A9J6H1V6_HAELO|nr:hypothetical protein HPB48_008172 [Haemaphysalis longicornis]